MRISDWSSDVCSSDLIDLVELGFVTAAAVIIGDIPIPAFSTNRQIPAQSGDDPENVEIGPAGRAIGDVVHVPEIGRASCRESGCPCVLISVVAVSFKKT